MRIQLQSLRIGAQFRNVDTGETGTLLYLCVPCRARVQWASKRTREVKFHKKGETITKAFPVTVIQSLPVTYEVEVGK